MESLILGLLDSGMQLMESRVPQTIGIQNLSSTDKISGFQYLESGIRVLGLYESKDSRMIFNWVVP